ncbi:MAG: hypothetical protein H7326_00695 [Bdellovibrionaceae bacterium]|nr:hypothetical protein [Pseudobdellovibrionaceae bacterium]
MERSHKVPKNLIKKMLGLSKTEKEDTWLPEQWEMADPLEDQIQRPAKPSGVVIHGRENPLLVNNFSAALEQVLLEESGKGMKIKLGEFHDWSPKAKQKYAGDYILGFSKIFISLAQGFTNWFMVTGTEPALREWVLQQPYNSITLHDIFRSSLRINNGDVYLTILTI